MTDKQYTSLRTMFIPMAEAYAHTQVKISDRRNRRAWDRCFLRRMTELCVEHGLINANNLMLTS